MTDATTSGLSEAPAGAPKTAGAWLRDARQQRGLHIAALAAMLKVPQAKLEALEADRWQDLTDMTFVRALAKAVCRALKVEAEPVLALLPRGGERELDVSRGINTPFRERSARDEGLSLAVLQKPMIWGPALLLAGAAALYLLPNRLLEPAPTAAPTAAASAPVEETPVLAAAPEPAASEAAAPVLAAVPLATPPAVTTASAPVPAAPVASRPQLQAPAQVAAAPASAPPAAGMLPVKVHVTAESWVSVTDAQGQVLLSKLVRPGEDPELAGQPPLKVTIGNVSGTTLSVRGTPFDLNTRNKDNVARFELN